MIHTLSNNISHKPRTEVCSDQKILKISNVKANISENKVFLRFTENVTLKIVTKHLHSKLENGINKNITLILDLKQIYKNGDCLVEMEQKNTLETSALDKFELDEELEEHFANNPFLSSPTAKIVDLGDSEDEEEKEDSSDNSSTSDGVCN